MSDGSKLGKYRLLHSLATGGMGEVFLARHEGPAGFSKLVVVKRLLPYLASDPVFVKLFLAEAKLAAQLSHPNVVQIYELGEESGSWFIAMEHVHGKSLRTVINQQLATVRSFPPVLAARIAWQALQGLEHAHRSKDEGGRPLEIVHRDVTPENLMLSYDGAVKLVDFGIAKATSAGTTHARTPKGKYSYMSPEQIGGGALDPRTDVYGLGVTLYELLSGVRPFIADNPLTLAKLISEAPPPPLVEQQPGLPEALGAIVMRAIDKDPARRFQSASEMALALERFIDESGERAGAEELSGLMRSLFDAEPLEPEGLLQSTAGLIRAPEPIRSGAAELPTAPISNQPAIPKRPRRRLVVAAAGVLAAALVTTAIASKAFEEAPRETPPALAAVAALPSEPAPPEPAPTEPPPPEPAQQPTHLKRTRTGHVTVRAHPWAEVFLSGKSLGTTPLAPIRVPAGRQVFVLKNGKLGVERKVSVLVPVGGQVLIKENLLGGPAP
jgi:eukaryotic-like serine/threonine-protein kinase